MEYALEERIGNPELFTGRHKELGFFLKWINDIKERKSHSTAILARRKMGKTAIMERGIFPLSLLFPPLKATDREKKERKSLTPWWQKFS